ncbi:MAG: biotin--[acetyl-CoA-carboxylase] ligase [Cyclobacteriaceae bacterium]|nr:biotin--[acetyl-CoA-carboxylase] ligase [Cyclobacteriaceae bacterium]
MYKILANTLFLGKNVVFVPECHSTNTLLIDLAQKTQQPEGTVVITRAQTKGRGQRGNGWEAEPDKNLTFSLLLKPHFLTASAQFNLTMAVSLALADFLKTKLPTQPFIKWPNDMLVNSKKITGILIENTLAGENIQQSVVGIGLNVNQRQFTSPGATSMSLETGQVYDLATELNILIEYVERRYLQLRSGHVNDLRQEYLNSLYWINEEQQFVSNGRIFKGIIEGVDAVGKLAVRNKGQINYFGIKEISFVR